MMRMICVIWVGLVVPGLLSSGSVWAQAATDVACDGCVQSGDIATNGVRRANIQNFSINAPKLSNFAVTSEKIKTGAVTTNKIAADAVGMAQIDQTQVQIRIGGSCEVGSFITAIAEDGSVTCEAGGSESDREAQFLSDSAIDLNFDFPLTWMGFRLFTCGQAYLYGCNKAVSGNGLQLDRLSYTTRSNSFRFKEIGGTGLRLWAVPVSVSDFSSIRFVGEANLYGARGMGRILVDDCDNPTVALLDNARNPRGDDNGPETIMNNSGLVYSRDSEIPTPVDVAGKTYGVMNFVQAEDPTPICTPGVSDRTGIWDQFTYTFAEDTNDPKFDGPYTYTGSTEGLIDRVQAQEARIQALEAAAP